MSSSISGTLELCHTHPRKCCFCFQQLTECERLRSTMLVKEMNNHLLDQLTSVLTTPGNLIADAPAQRMEMHSARVSDVTSHITTKSETHARLQPNQRRAFRVVRLKLQIGKKTQETVLSHLDGVLASPALACQWPCADLRSSASGPRAACTPSPSRSTSTLAAERRGES
jgi:hypothetical protein